MWEEGEGRALIADTLSSIQHKIPALRNQLPAGWRLYRAWTKHELPARAPPLTKKMVWALSGLAFKENRGDVAISLLIAFEGLLRTGELTSLTKADFDVAGDFSNTVINLGFTKSGSRIGAKESVTIENKDMSRLIAARLLNLQPGDLLLPKGSFEFRRVFKHLVEELKLTSLGFKPYSLRRGGATHHFRTCGQLSRTVVKGRWTNARTARVYINEGLAVLASFSCPESDKHVISHLKHFLACTKLTPHPDL
jgi:hypothetical protein